MARILPSLPPAGTALGIAFSGGLDTRAAVAWLHKKGMAVHAYTADLAQPDEKDPAAIVNIALEHGARTARLIDCRAALAREGLLALRSGAFHLSTAGKKYFNTTPLGRAVTTTAIVKAMQADNVHIFGDGSTHRGNDIQRFYRYGVLVNPQLQIYKPWLDEAFSRELGGRGEMSDFLSSLGKPYTMAREKAYSTDSNLLGATHEAKQLEQLDCSMKIVEPIMGLPFWRDDANIKKEEVEIKFQSGIPVAINGSRMEAVELIMEANRIGGRHGLGMSDQIENRVIEAKSRGIYEAPGMALLHLAYERLLSAIHNEASIDTYVSLGRRLGRLLYEGRWYDPEALMLKEALRWIALPVNGKVRIELRRGDDYTILDTKADESAYDAEKLSMEKTTGLFSPSDRSGALALQDAGILGNRQLLMALLKKEALPDHLPVELEG
ncbi:MAG: argininosuccinate synthase [Spirochaetales bacterium]|nr:argininosuccinate synthase [Spirochaetales bacterium]